MISDDLTFGLDLESAGCIQIPGPGPSSAHGLMMFDVWDALPKCQQQIATVVCCIPFSMFFDKSDDVLNFQFLQMMI